MTPKETNTGLEPFEAKVVRRGKALYVTCLCKRWTPLGGYGAAHLGTCDLRGSCRHCGRPQIIRRTVEDDE